MPDKKDKFVLQNDNTGTIHQIRRDGKTYCGRPNGPNDKRRRLSSALKHKNAHLCNTPGKCMAHA